MVRHYLRLLNIKYLFELIFELICYICYLIVIRVAMMIEQIGSAIFQPKNLMSNDDIITPTLPEKLEIKLYFWF